MKLEGLFAGPVARFPDDARPTAMVKHPLREPVHVGREGLAGDALADRRVHGGPERALHHFPAEHYADIAAAFPMLASPPAPGTLGENVSTLGLTECDVRIGDVFELGSARVQLSQPRRPCWKIDRRLGVEGVAAWVQQRGLTGWYYRVLSPGRAGPDDGIVLLERDDEAPTLEALHAAMREPQPGLALLRRWAALEALAADWRQRLHERCEWLARHDGR